VASATKLVVAQRMMKKICQKCKEEINLTEQQVDSLRVPQELLRNIRAWRGKGCSSCNNTGKAGRTGIYEVMPVTPGIERAILDQKADTDIRDIAIKEGMFTLRMAAVEKMKAGHVSLEEVFAVSSA
jgi:type IV pilus assembly protein PilB